VSAGPRSDADDAVDDIEHVPGLHDGTAGIVPGASHEERARVVEMLAAFVDPPFADAVDPMDALLAGPCRALATLGPDDCQLDVPRVDTPDFDDTPPSSS
jgi:hypothetical protein